MKLHPAACTTDLAMRQRPRCGKTVVDGDPVLRPTSRLPGVPASYFLLATVALRVECFLVAPSPPVLRLAFIASPSGFNLFFCYPVVESNRLGLPSVKAPDMAGIVTGTIIKLEKAPRVRCLNCGRDCSLSSIAPADHLPLHQNVSRKGQAYICIPRSDVRRRHGARHPDTVSASASKQARRSYTNVSPQCSWRRRCGKKLCEGEMSLCIIQRAYSIFHSLSTGFCPRLAARRKHRRDINLRLKEARVLSSRFSSKRKTG